MDSQSLHVPSNEPEPGVYPTDRLRPDQCSMENGDFDNANVEKVCSKFRLSV